MAHGRIQKLVDCAESASGEDQLHTYKFIALFHVAQELDFALGARRKIRVATFRTRNNVPAPTPEQDCFAQPSSSGKHGLRGLRRGNSLIENGNLRWFERCQTVT